MTRTTPTTGTDLLRLLRGFPLEGFERSFKMSDRLLLAERFLAGIHKSHLAPGVLVSICREAGLPERHLGELIDKAQDANAIHFGFEGGPEGGLYKVYLEYAGRLREVAPGDELKPVLLHLAYKWYPVHPAQVAIARYVCYPGLPVHAITERLKTYYGGRMELLQAVLEMIRRCGLPGKEAPMYLEVTEQNNPRESFDINLHEAGIPLGDALPWLTRVREHYSIPEHALGQVMAQAGPAHLGHLSGGINREGRSFLTVYYAGEPP